MYNHSYGLTIQYHTQVIDRAINKFSTSNFMLPTCSMPGVLLFSGRWRLGGNKEIIRLYKHNLITPYNLDVVFGAAQSQLCTPQITPRAFSKIVQLQWNMHTRRFRSFLISSKDHDVHIPELSSSSTLALTPWKLFMINNWRVQFHHLRLTLEHALQWKLHTFYVRCRFDMLLLNRPSFNVNLLKDNVYVMNHTSHLPFHPLVMDWFYVASLRAMSIMTDTRHALFNVSERCHAACPEEQLVMQLQRRSLTYLRTHVILKRIPKDIWCTSNGDS